MVCFPAIPCQPLRAPTNGMVTPSTCTSTIAKPNTNCTVTCKTGYSLYGASTLTCNANGQWSTGATFIRCIGMISLSNILNIMSVGSFWIFVTCLLYQHVLLCNLGSDLKFILKTTIDMYMYFWDCLMFFSTCILPIDK